MKVSEFNFITISPVAHRAMQRKYQKRVDVFSSALNFCTRSIFCNEGVNSVPCFILHITRNVGAPISKSANTIFKIFGMN